MIDLTGVKVGEKYLTEDNQECSVVAIGHYTVCFNLTVVDFLFVTNDDGKPSETHNGCKELTIKCKVDPRPWLKDLPDADLFSDDVDYILCTERGWEFKLKSSFSTSDMTMVKMPVITSDQCKDSYITIVKLKAWQVENLPF